MMNSVYTLCAATALAGATCAKPAPPPEPPYVIVDASSDAAPRFVATPEQACANLYAVGCPEGASGYCAQVLASMVDLHIDTRLDCLVAAHDKDAVRACTPAVLCR